MSFSFERRRRISAKTVNLAEVVAVKGLKARGNRLTPHAVERVHLVVEETQEAGEAEETSSEQLQLFV